MRASQHKQPNKRDSFFKIYFSQHIEAALSSLSQLSRTPISSLFTCVIIGIALALPATLYVVLKNVEELSQSFQQTTQLTVYLKQNVSENQVVQLTKTLQHDPSIQEAHAVSPQQGIQELQQQAGMQSVLMDLQNNPLPWAITVVPAVSQTSPAALSSLNHRLARMEDVESVQFDSQWVERLFVIIALAHRVVYGLAFFLGLGVLLIVNNCIRSATQNSQKEIHVIKLIGGTNAFVRRPFLYAGMVYGLLGGILAWQLVDLLMLWVRNPAHQLAALYHSQFSLMSISLSDTFVLLISSIALGLVGAWLAVSRYLHSLRSI